MPISAYNFLNLKKKTLLYNVISHQHKKKILRNWMMDLTL